MNSRRRFALKSCAASALGAALLSPGAFAAEAWPSRPITYSVPFTPGGSTDVVGRTQP